MHGPPLGIEPGTLALCLGYQREQWALANAAMQHIYTEQKPVWQEVNRIAAAELGLDELHGDSAAFLCKVMGMCDE